NITQIELAANHPLRLGVILNYSDFYNEVQNSPNRACHHTKLAVHDDLAELHSLPEEPFGNSSLRIWLFRYPEIDKPEPQDTAQMRR
ncbi:14-3-3 protein, partial [Fusarium oxysporum f. sp. albedinis]